MRVEMAYKSTVLKNKASAQKGVIGKVRMKNLETAVRNRNRRINYASKPLLEVNENASLQKLAQQGYIPGQLVVDLKQIKTVKDYNRMMRLLNEDKSKSARALRAKAQARSLRNSIVRSINIDESDDPELFEKLSKMSDRDIASLRLNNKTLIRDIYDEYKSSSAIDEYEQERLHSEIRMALGLSKKVKA